MLIHFLWDTSAMICSAHSFYAGRYKMLNKKIIFKYLTESDKASLWDPAVIVDQDTSYVNRLDNSVSIYDNFLYVHLNLLVVSEQKSMYCIIKDAIKLIEISRYKRLRLSLAMQLVVIFSCVVSVLAGLDRILKPVIIDSRYALVGLII
jgi:hypothetical protein